ncbi:MAG: carbamoyl phosphate synthase small subunit [Candidatus Fraserbacteria bacterium RBG_16_55_9]|uniref:Carbamoyl phosphate synthase small chain n=1 Tax=Fraserbacteria sp. (strain RBG_16_55_9) TaxID=1817864 RepID=A0A1F5UPK4_FRAXR|nr:MAG: carbamoyl phosphate synthase small subunit [Candidatus Fraserbacteria bacterium RBG_16_55_9]
MMALLALEDGKIFAGESFGARGTVCGEVVFNTCLTGYIEVLTDPSYKGQIVTMTYPHIGNYGVTLEDLESHQPHVTGFIVREYSKTYSNWRAQGSLEEFLKTHDIIGLSEIDTRALTLHIRQAGAMRACLTSEEAAPDELVERARAFASISEQDLVSQVTCSQVHAWDDASDPQWISSMHEQPPEDLHVVAYDFGIKHNILRCLHAHVRQVTVVPAQTTADQVCELKPDGIFLSNGPGDPERVSYAIQTIRKLIEKDIPIFGICLGHQLMGLALGAHSYKLKFGHRGGNQPVKNLETGKVEITTHNHGFALRDLPPELEITHINLNDDTIEGMRVKGTKSFSVQYHPEAAPGPHDSTHLFKHFVELMK